MNDMIPPAGEPAGNVTSSPGLPPAQVPCQTCGAPRRGELRSPNAFVYAIGRIEPRFPSPGVEKELAQAIGRAETVKLTDHQTIHRVLSVRENRYLVRQLCWVLTIQGLDTYVLQPRDPGDFDLLVGALRAAPSNDDLDVVIGLQAGFAPPEMCNGLTLPLLAIDQVYSFDRDSFVQSIPRPEEINEKDFKPAAEEIFSRLIQMTGNAGATDEHRAVNYLAVRYPTLYAAAAAAFASDAALSAVDVRRAPLGGPRSTVDVILSFTNRKTDVVGKQAVRVDVTEEFPFLVAKLAPYFDH